MRVSIIVLCALLIGCSDTHESLMDEELAAMKDLNGVLASATDEASAKAAIPKVEKIAERLRDLNERAAKLTKPTVEEMVARGEKYRKLSEPVLRDLTSNMMRVMSNPTLRAQLQRPLEGIKPPGR